MSRQKFAVQTFITKFHTFSSDKRLFSLFCYCNKDLPMPSYMLCLCEELNSCHVRLKVEVNLSTDALLGTHCSTYKRTPKNNTHETLALFILILILILFFTHHTCEQPYKLLMTYIEQQNNTNVATSLLPVLHYKHRQSTDNNISTHSC